MASELSSAAGLNLIARKVVVIMSNPKRWRMVVEGQATGQEN